LTKGVGAVVLVGAAGLGELTLRTEVECERGSNRFGRGDFDVWTDAKADALIVRLPCADSMSTLKQIASEIRLPRRPLE
jgi:hypothetical protein